MITVTVKEDADVLLPNKQHKNFTKTGEVIEEGTTLVGKPQNIEGMRRGKKFIYRLFVTDKNQIIYLKKINPMKATEVTLGADSQQSPTVVNVKPAEKAMRAKFIGAAAGAVAGFAWAKYKKKDNKAIIKMIAIGAVAGFAIGYLIDSNNNKIKVTPSK